MSYLITKEIAFEAGHRLINYEGKCKNLHGHNYILRIGLESNKLSEQGFVEDFGYIKQVVKEWIEKNIDHGMVLHIKDYWVDILKSKGQKIYLMEVNPTAEAMAEHFYHLFKSSFPNLKFVEIDETPTSKARYTE